MKIYETLTICQRARSLSIAQRLQVEGENIHRRAKKNPIEAAHPQFTENQKTHDFLKSADRQGGE